MKTEYYNAEQIISIKVFDKHPDNDYIIKTKRKYVFWGSKQSFVTFMGIRTSLSSGHVIENGIIYKLPYATIRFNNRAVSFACDTHEKVVAEVQKIMNLSGKWFEL